MSKFENNAVTWFEIPTSDFDRATNFYTTMLEIEFKPFPGPEPCNVFPAGENGIAGCIVQRATQKPGESGAIVYLNANGKLDVSLERAKKLGAQIPVPRTEIPGGFGFFACLVDSEGNHVGLHSLGN